MTIFGANQFGKIFVGLALTANLLLAGCGGGRGEGDGEGGGGGGGGGIVTTTISGIAASGAPIVGYVTAKDSIGTTFIPTTISPTGAYTVNVSGGIPPFILQATGVTHTGNPVTYYSFAGSGNAANINITPFTDMVVAQASGQSPSMAYLNCFAVSCVLPNATQINAAELAVNTSLGNLFALFNVNPVGLNLLTSPFVSGAIPKQSAIDVLLDAITVAANPSQPTSYDIIATGTTGLANTVLATLPAVATGTPLPVNSAFTASAVATAQANAKLAILGGSYAGTYTDGAWQLDVTTDGVASGSALPVVGSALNIAGTVLKGGKATFGNVASGDSFSGTFAQAGGATGTWSNLIQAKSGTLTGAKVDVVTAFAGTHSGTFIGADSGTWAITAAGGAIVGTEKFPVDGSKCSINGVIGNNGTIVFVTNGLLTGGTRCGATFLGSYSAVSASISGSWANSGITGTFSGN